MKKNINHIVTIALSLLLIIYFSSCSSYKVEKLNKAQIEYMYNLNIVYDYINADAWKDLPNRSIDDALAFLEEVTAIESTRTRNITEIREPTKEDYLNWKNWYTKNKNKLYRDAKTRKVAMKK